MILASLCQCFLLFSLPTLSLTFWKSYLPVSSCECCGGSSSMRPLCCLDFCLAASQEKTSHHLTLVMPHGRQTNTSPLFSEMFTHCYDQMPLYPFSFQWYIELFCYLFIHVLFIPKPFTVQTFSLPLLQFFNMAITEYLSNLLRIDKTQRLALLYNKSILWEGRTTPSSFTASMSSQHYWRRDHI